MLYPQIDPVIFSIGPLTLHWYGFLYLVSFVGAWALASRYAPRVGMSSAGLADLIFYAALGVVVGGRFGYILFYQPAMFASDPLVLFRIWEGGMSFHGGLLGVTIACWVFARSRGFTFLQIADIAAPITPIGLGLGRIGNFINGELPGRVTELPWGLRYPCEAVYALNPDCVTFGAFEEQMRHPSSLYQALLEGVILLSIMLVINRKQRPTGFVAGMFLILYGLFRLVSENFRSPDAHIGMLFGGALTLGQILSIPVLLFGVLVVYLALKQNIYASADGKSS